MKTNTLVTSLSPCPLLWREPCLQSFSIYLDSRQRGVAPSYYLEGLLYNLPNDKFTSSYEDCFVICINWIQEADRSKFVCASEQYYHLWEDLPVTWRAQSAMNSSQRHERVSWMSPEKWRVPTMGFE